MKAILNKSFYLSVISSIRRIKFGIKLFPDYLYDYIKYLKYSATVDTYSTKLRYQGRITAHYHVVEKGLSLKNTRKGFGSGIVAKLVVLLEEYKEKYKADELCQFALNALTSYHQFNLQEGENNQDLQKKLVDIRNFVPTDIISVEEGGVIEFSNEDIYSSAMINFKDFAFSRYSVRQFSSKAVSLNIIEEAVSIAIKTPSVCNRQTWKVHVFSDDILKKRVLSHQNGNRGFGDQSSLVILVTSDLNYFLDRNERNQCFIDGGMFAMSLVYALHSLGLGTCCLNWAVSHEKDIELRRDIVIEDSEVIIMMIAVGHLLENFTVANSPRKTVSDILTVH